MAYFPIKGFAEIAPDVLRCATRYDDNPTAICEDRFIYLRYTEQGALNWTARATRSMYVSTPPNAGRYDVLRMRVCNAVSASGGCGR